MAWQMSRFLGPEFIPNHRKCLQGNKMRLLDDKWVVCSVFGWFVGGLAGLWVVCGWFGWFAGGLWMVWMVCGWFG